MSWFSGHSSYVPYINNMLFRCRPLSVKARMNNCTHVLKHMFGGMPSLPSSPSNSRGLSFFNHRLVPQRRSRIYAAVEVASAIDVINDLGLDTLTFLAVTVLVVPAFKIIRASPVRINTSSSISLSNCSFFLHCHCMYRHYIYAK